MIVALGKFAAQSLLQTTDPITRLRGRDSTYRGATLIPTFHPAYLLRNPSSKRDVWEDMKKVRAILKAASEPVLSPQRARRVTAWSDRLVSVAVPVAGAGSAHLPRSDDAADAGRRRARGRATRHAARSPASSSARPPPPADDVDAARCDRRCSTIERVSPADVVQLTDWVADYYLAGPGAALAAAMPPHALTSRVDAFDTIRVVSADGRRATISPSASRSDRAARPDDVPAGARRRGSGRRCCC